MSAKRNHIRTFHFSGPTYQIEVFDQKAKRSFWTFFQFDENGILKDAFCECEEDACNHLFLAHQKIYNENDEPTHVRYKKSFWQLLATIVSEKIGFDLDAVKKIKKGIFEAKNSHFFRLEAKNKEGERKLNSLFKKKEKETPENSLKFSNLTEDEIQKWKEGRPSKALQLELSFLSDLAKYLQYTEENFLPLKIDFQEKSSNETIVVIETEDLIIECLLEKEELIQLTPKWGSLKTKKKKQMPQISGELISLERKTLSYFLFFDEAFNLHIVSYLFEIGDLQKEGNALYKNHAYIKGKGYFALQNVLFDEVETVIMAKDVAKFVTKNRSFLNEMTGFQTHLSSVETEISYTLDQEKKTLNFSTRIAGSDTAYDFGEWVYFKDLGFFPKKEGRFKAFFSGLKVPFSKVASFLRTHKEELEFLFIEDSPFRKRGLHVGVKEETIFIRPEFEVYKRFLGSKLLFFDEFVFVEKQGFFEMPYSMRVPPQYNHEVIIDEKGVTPFLENELPKLKPHIITLENGLKWVTNLAFNIDFIEKSEDKILCEFSLKSNVGEAPLIKIFEAMQKKRSYVFTDAGLINLHEPVFEWIRPLNTSETKFSLSYLEFLRLDALLDFSVNEAYRKNLAALREFIYPELPNLKNFKSELREYQKQGLRWLYFLYQNHLSGILCDDMGLGKTHQAMALMASIMVDKPKALFLIVAPTSVIYHWQEKLKEFLPKVSVHIFHGAKRRKKIPKKGVILTSYGIVRVEKEKLSSQTFDLGIYDELQVAKNAHSQIHHVLRQLNTKMALGLTGTPIENNLFELKALFDIVLPNYLPKEKPFKEMFADPITKQGDQKRKVLLRRYVGPFLLRRKKSEVLLELPKKSVDKSYTILSPKQAELYRQVLEEKKKIITDVKDSSKEIPYMHIFSILATLKQICNHPALVLKDPENYKKYASGKWDLFTELLNEAIESEQKVVVFSQYLTMLDIIQSYVRERNWQFAEIRGATTKRKEELDRFKKDPHCLIFLGSLQAAGLGIDLTASSLVILYDRWWNAAKENQAIDRVHRIGQKWPVLVYKLITKDTIEEKIDLMIAKKGHLLEDIITTDDQATLKTFTRTELIDLLSLNI